VVLTSCSKGIIRARADFTEAIRLNPDNAYAYFNRGKSRSELRDKQGAIADFQKAANIFQQQGKMRDYKNAVDTIQKLMRT
jgi:tetratricopeptide (TPR) repeat protein